MVAQWLGMKPDVVTPYLRYNVPQYQKAKSAYDVFLKQNPQLSAPTTGSGSPGLYGNYNDFIENIPATGIPGFSPTNRVKITKAPGSVAPAVKASATPKAPVANTTNAEEIFNF